MTLNEYINDFCKERGMLKYELAQKAGVAKNVFYSWDKKGCTPRESTLEALAKVLEVPPEELSRLIVAKKPVIKQPTQKQFIKYLNAAIAKRKRQRKKLEKEAERKEIEVQKRKDAEMQAERKRLAEEREFSGYLNDLSRDKADVRRWFACHDFNEV